MKELRIFPRRTNATPDDENVIINWQPNLFDFADKINISVTFSYDMKKAELLYNQWKHVAPTEMGGPAFNLPEDDFIPGRFIKQGYVITSRGCPNRCWFCKVWTRQPEIKELPINEGWNVLDDNLLACSDRHIKAVFEMLKKQNRKARFTGGIEAKRLREWHCELFANLKPELIYFAYDTPDDFPYLITAGEMLRDYGFGKSHNLLCYVLIGYENDTLEKALVRIKKTINAGFMPFAMRYRDENGLYLTERKWNLFQREWTRPQIVTSNMRKYLTTKD